MILLQANNVARYFGADVLFEHIQLTVQDTSKIALVGRNGAGKSTLLKIIAGIDQTDAGQVTKAKGLSIGYLAQNTGFTSEKTIWDAMLETFAKLIALEERIRSLEVAMGEPNLSSDDSQRLMKEYDSLQHQFQEQNGYTYQAEIKAILNGFRFDESYYDRPVNSLSGGQKTRLALAKLLLEQPNLLILDEPTNHLDIDTLSWLENYLQNYRGALLIVSHDRYFLDKVVNEVYEISRRKMTHYKGNYTKYLDLKAAQLEQDWKAFEKQQDEINKLEDFVARNLARASTTKRAQSRRKQLEKMERLDKPMGDEKSARIQFNVEKSSGNVVLQLEQAAIGYDQEILSEPINLDVRKQEAIALVGPNGIGKSTLLKSLIGKHTLIKGQPHFGTNVAIGYYDQEQSDLRSNKTVLHELWDEHPTTPEKDIRSILGSFLFSGDDVTKAVPSLSGGEKARLALAKLSMDQQNFLILDEPTNHLDIDSKEVLEDALIEFEGTLLFVSHDRYFINRIATKVIELGENGTTEYLGDYDYYVAKKAELAEIERLKAEQQQQATNSTVSAPTSQNAFYQSKEVQRETRKLQRKIDEIEARLEAIEVEVEQRHLDMTSPDILSNHTELGRLQAEVEALEEEQMNLMDEWETISTELESYQN
ncbi:ABC-F family ATP-binding cassette domain-containing protein [Vagococcus zengguangii]|uniref:ABC-F family ATP-binding cassette domain-containing protein n=1 Tax=Vagococcus zengguangii TaxID=2571750 RepID=A0A4D7CSG5_9ENTE|nr:ABC-F family ATP-binding cassette domain-containing protein [Vagococcus zengguangii]QCI87225.1 ABC-F family ATP-binding cassette domain-containing protein [Vagococcus zengguangii]TLG80729.1 ABC-F family ATP-binding cassette domain-containing protein [Vagococcus zengguangii]